MNTINLGDNSQLEYSADEIYQDGQLLNSSNRVSLNRIENKRNNFLLIKDCTLAKVTAPPYNQ